MRTLTTATKKSFIAAAKSVQKKPSTLPAGQVPGAKSLWDDFMFGNFLTWHRYFTSPLFDGSATSLGSDGVAVKQRGHPGTGGGCIASGPSSDLVVRLGPDNPRCLSRDLSADTAKRFASFRNTTELIMGQQTVEMFEALLSGDPRYVTGEVGVYGGGHDLVGGEMPDPFTPPHDPFSTLLNLPLVLTLQHYCHDFLNVSPLNSTVKIKDMINTVCGPLCYVYI
ncbi:hypothetical protein B0T24DRAFT_654995 [Lasiosphaeria ovina]|uniref:Tyrosinase copper-binding domain-containing protein n=1 Tax=Lasiosphaeria ovina TaxID=92902 RepID=A0AAE0ND53_9PEZI|nr:hypothetical protein B0T24DRAFT_654995 [Lasiosphaeria ovina]